MEDELRRALKPLVGGRSIVDALSASKHEAVVAQDAIDAIVEELRQIELAWREEVSKISAERQALMQQAEQLTLKVKKISALDTKSECPTCSQPLGETFDEVQAHCIAERDEVVARVVKLRELEKSQAVEPPQLIACRESLVKARSDADKIQAKAQELRKCEQIEGKLAGILNDQRLIEIEIKSARENLERAQKKAATFNFSEDDYLREKGAYDAAQRLLEVARLQRVRVEGELNTHAAMVARSVADIERFDERQADIEKIRRQARLFDECDRIVTEFRKFVNSSIRPRMAELASEYLTDLTDGRYSAVELAEDFTPTVVEDGEAKGVISGGEEDILNLCMRLSLSHMLAERAGQSFSLLMLDEVFGSLDEGRRGNVLTLLEKLRRRFEQIIIITHLDDIKDGVQHTIQVEYDEEDGSALIVDENVDERVFAEVLNL